MGNTKWKQPPNKEGFNIDNRKHTLKKIKMNKDMNFSNIETFIDILDDIEPTEKKETKEGFVPTPIIPGVGLDENEDYDGNDDIDKKKKNVKGGTMFHYLRYISYIFSYLYILLRYLTYRTSEFIFDIFANTETSENFVNVNDINIQREKTTQEKEAEEMKNNIKEAPGVLNNTLDETNQNTMDMKNNTNKSINKVGEILYSERYYLKAFNTLNKEFNGKTKKRAIDVELDDTDKGNDMKIISNNLMWLLSIALGSSMSYTFYYYMFYTERIDRNSDDENNETTILDGGVNTRFNLSEHHGNRVNFLPKGASVNKLAKDLLCEYTFSEDSDSQFSNLWDLIPSFFYKVLKPIVGIVEMFHNVLFVYLPNVINGEHGFLGKDIIPFIPNIGNLLKNIGLSTNGTKFMLITVMSSFFIYYSGSDFFKYIIGTLTGKPEANFFTLFIYLLISIVSFGLIYDSFKDLSKKTGLSDLKEGLVGKNAMGSMAKNVASSAKDKTTNVIESLRGKKITGGSTEDNGDFELQEKCQDFNDNQSIFIKTLFGLESKPYIGGFAYPVMLVFNILIFFAILFTLFGFGPIAIFLYVIGIFGYSLVNSDSKMKDNIDIMTQLGPDDEINADVNIDSTWLNNNARDDIETANNYLNKINTVSYKLYNNILLQNSISIFIVVSLFYASSDIYKNTKNTNVRSILTILTSMVAVFYGVFTFMTTKIDILINYSDVLKMLNIDKSDDRYEKLMELLSKSPGYGNDLFTNYTTDDIELLFNNVEFQNILTRDNTNSNNKMQGGDLISDNPLLKSITSATSKGLESIGNLLTGKNNIIHKDKFILAIYYSIIKNKFGKYKPLSKQGSSFYDFGQNVHAKQTLYNKKM